MTTPTRPNSRNPWPYALIGTFAVFITWIAMFITLAVRQDMDLVREDYYEEELRHQQQVDRLERSQALQGRVQVQYNPEAQDLDIVLPMEPGQALPTGRVHFYRPSDASLDHEIPLQIDAAGRQTMDLRDLQQGLWRVHLYWERNGQEFYAQRTVVIPPAKS